MGELQGVLIDMDGTLVDSEKIWDVSLEQLAEHLGGELTPALRASLVGSSLEGTIAALHAAFDVDPAVSPAASAAYLVERTEDLFRTDIRWRPGAQELLAALAAAGIPVALVTSTHRRLTEVVLDTIGRHWFRTTVCGDEVAHVKPHPDPYLRAAALLGVSPLHCAAIEDSDTGTASAVAAGCATLTVPCDAPVPDGPGRTFADSMLDVDPARLELLVRGPEPQHALDLDLTAFDALSFDCYGTLIDWETGLLDVLRPWARRHDLAVTDGELLQRYAAQERVVTVEQPAAVYPRVLAESVRRLGRTLGAEVTADDADRLAGSVPDWPAFDDSADALAALGRHYRLMVLSNIDRDSFRASQRRLNAPFTSVITAQDVGSYKPAAANFVALQQEAARLGVPQGRLLHVAQSLFHDHVPAKAAGLPTVWINRRHDVAGQGATPEVPGGVEPDLEFPDLASFAAAVDAAFGS